MKQHAADLASPQFHPHPCCRLYVRSSQRHRTGVISSRHPRWKEAFELPIHVQEHQKLVRHLVLQPARLGETLS